MRLFKKVDRLGQTSLFLVWTSKEILSPIQDREYLQQLSDYQFRKPVLLLGSEVFCLQHMQQEYNVKKENKSSIINENGCLIQ